MSKLWRVGKEELRYIEEEIEAGLTGISNRKLEERFAEKFGVNFALGVNSGTSALHCCLEALGVKEDDEVIVPPLTFSAPTFAVLQQKAIPVFADIDEETWNISPKEIEKKITPKTKAIIPVSLYGLPTDIEAIMKIARENNLKVIEDNAECFFGKYKGKPAGSLADMSIFSFERSKHLTTGHGGMIITNDQTFGDRARKFSILGYATVGAKQTSYKNSKDMIQQPGFKRHETIGYNYRLPELCAAMALAQLDKADMLIKKRQDIAKLYAEAIKNCEWIKPQKVPDNFEHSYWTYVIRIDTSKVDWMEFRKKFLENGGERFYAAWSLTYLEPFLEGGGYPAHNIKYEKGLCPVAERVQPELAQLKTNFESLDYARKQAECLKKTIEQLS